MRWWHDVPGDKLLGNGNPRRVVLLNFIENTIFNYSELVDLAGDQKSPAVGIFKFIGTNNGSFATYE